MSAQKKISWITYLLLSLTSLVILSGISLMVLLAYGTVEGEEFSPDNFSRRRFEYMKIPGLNWVVRGIVYDDVTTDFENSLAVDGWIDCKPATTWHLCRESQRVQPAECDARFLVDMLQIKTDSSVHQYFWEEWNEKYPELAKVFWPLIAQMARDELYLGIPEIMRLAMDVKHREQLPSAEAFEAELKQQLADAYQQQAEFDQANGRAERSQARLQRAAELRTE
jgi:hypothetical protein